MEGKYVPINGKKPTIDEWTLLRIKAISIEQVKTWLSTTSAERIAILLDNSLLPLDYDGISEHVVWNKLVPRCSEELQNAKQPLLEHHTEDISPFRWILRNLRIELGKARVGIIPPHIYYYTKQKERIRRFPRISAISRKAG